MRKHALINNNIVTAFVYINNDDEYRDYANNNQLVIDIEDDLTNIQLGYILQGNTLVPMNTVPPTETTDLYQQITQRLFGLKILPDLIDQVGARNLRLAREQVPVDVVSLATQMSSIKILLEGGALKTVRGICSVIKPTFPHHADILDSAINKITNFLIENKWD